jgi:hypothetical protein
MSEAWQNFAIVVVMQFILFLLHAWYEKRLSDVPRILFLSVMVGILFGIVFDLIVGKFLSFFEYELGFTLLFLILNGALSYGFMQANTLLMDRVSFVHFYAWSVFIGVVYEITNYLHPVWAWDFGSPVVELFVVHAFVYIGLATLMALTWHFVIRHKFAFVENFLEREKTT